MRRLLAGIGLAFIVSACAAQPISAPAPTASPAAPDETVRCTADSECVLVSDCCAPIGATNATHPAARPSLESCASGCASSSQLLVAESAAACIDGACRLVRHRR
jgi:hypothetical protein